MKTLQITENGEYNLAQYPGYMGHWHKDHAGWQYGSRVQQRKGVVAKARLVRDAYSKLASLEEQWRYCFRSAADVPQGFHIVKDWSK